MNADSPEEAVERVNSHLVPWAADMAAREAEAAALQKQLQSEITTYQERTRTLALEVQDTAHRQRDIDQQVRAFLLFRDHVPFMYVRSSIV